MKKTRFVALFAALALVLAACGGDDTNPSEEMLDEDPASDDDADATASDDDDSMDPDRMTGVPVEDDPDAPLVGSFTVLIPPEGSTEGAEASTSFQGAVRDGAALELTTWTVLEDGGDCVLSEPSIPFCDPACESGSACTTGDQCQAHPEAHSVGMVTLKGLALEDGETEFSLTPLKPNFNYLPGASVRLAYPPAEEGAEVALTSEGGDFSPIAVTTKGIAILEVEAAGSALPISSEAGLTLKWQPPKSSKDSQIFVELDISHHGGARGKINCQTADDGELEIPQSLIAGLIELGFSGFPTISIARKSSGGANIEAGRIVFEIVSALELPLSIPGLVSCTDTAECEDGQTCAADRTCQ